MWSVERESTTFTFELFWAACGLFKILDSLKREAERGSLHPRGQYVYCQTHTHQFDVRVVVLSQVEALSSIRPVFQSSEGRPVSLGIKDVEFWFIRLKWRCHPPTLCPSSLENREARCLLSDWNGQLFIFRPILICWSAPSASLGQTVGIGYGFCTVNVAAQIYEAEEIFGWVLLLVDWLPLLFHLTEIQNKANLPWFFTAMIAHAVIQLFGCRIYCISPRSDF